jgi:aspartate/tyrosine/aromatic aminotransferase
MFETIPTAPVDPILGLNELFKKDQTPHKLNLSIGIYQDATGQTPILETVKEAERRRLATEKTKTYLPMTGDPTYGLLVQKLVFGENHPIITSSRAATAHTPGGTCALRVTGDYLHKLHPATSVWLSDPTWENHRGVFTAAGVAVKSYAYRDPATNGLNFDAMMASLKQVPAGDAVLLHACCHNPTGIDPTLEQWKQLGELFSSRGITPIVDFAYQGLAEGISEDAAGLRSLCDKVPELFVCSSFSKNFGLYRERTGAFTVVTAKSEYTEKVFSQVKLVIRTNYSNPPAHGGALVTTILGDAKLRAQWEQEVAQIRQRINSMRRLFVEKLKSKGINRDYSPILRQRGMFSFSGLTKEQVDALREKHAIYTVGSGRINVAGINESNVDRLCEAIKAVL